METIIIIFSILAISTAFLCLFLTFTGRDRLAFVSMVICGISLITVLFLALYESNKKAVTKQQAAELNPPVKTEIVHYGTGVPVLKVTLEDKIYLFSEEFVVQKENQTIVNGDKFIALETVYSLRDSILACWKKGDIERCKAYRNFLRGYITRGATNIYNFNK